MMLEEKENLVLAKLIGLVNGMDEFLPTSELEKDIKFILTSLKNHSNLDICLDLLKKNKSLFLPNCLTCASPCGRTNDYSLNDISLKIKKEDRINEYLNYINSFDESSSLNDILYNISKLSW